MVAVKAAEADRFVDKPDPSVDAILVYGPDQGLVSERAGRLLAHLAQDPDDPFSVSRLDEAELARNPSRLIEEVSALAFGAGRRTVVLKGASGAGVEAVVKAVSADRAAYLLVTAGDLRPSSGLRKAFEQGRGCAAIPCYADDDRSMVRLIDQVVAELDQSIEPVAREALLARLGADRLSSRAEIEKLALYAGPGARIELADVDAICADASETTLERVFDAMGEGDRERLEGELFRSAEAGTGPGQLARGALLHLQLLHRLVSDVAAGTPAASAMGRTRPPIHFRRRDSMVSQVRLWSEPGLRRALALAGECERASRGDQALASTSVSRALLQIAMLARAEQRRRGPAHGRTRR